MKKLISIMLSLALVVSSFAISSTALAEESKCANVFLSAVYCGDNLFDPVTVDVSADLDKTYDVGYTDDSEEPTILDAIIAMQIETFGEEDFALDPQTYFSVSDKGWILICFGDDGSMCSYYHNGSAAWSITEELADGDYVEFTMLYSDNYAYFNTRSVDTEINESVSFTLYNDGYDSNWDFVSGMMVEDATVFVDGVEYGTTNANGLIAITFNSCGKHIITAKKDNLMIPYCEVTVTNHFADYMGVQIKNATDYLIANGTTYGGDSLSNLLNYAILFDANPEDYADEIESVLLQAKENMDTNDGKLMYAVDYYGNVDEDLAAYGALIGLANSVNDASDFYGYNLYEIMENVPVDKVSNPYNYRFAIDNARDKFKTAICDSFVKNYYTLGKGMNYWGYSCDNTAMFIVAMATAPSQFDKYVDDALSVMNTYITTNGAGYSKEYPDENADSTALALMAYISDGQYTNALKMYMCLVNNFQSSTKGVMLTTINGKKTKNVIATKDGLLGINELYHYAVANGKSYHPYKKVVTPATTKANGKRENICFICGSVRARTDISRISTVKLSKTSYVYSGSAKTPSVTVTDKKGNKISSSNYTVKHSNNTKVGKASVKVTFKGNYSGTVTKTFTIVPKSTTVSKATPKKKALAITWKKQSSQTTGYQVQIATNKSFTKGVKSYISSKNTTTSKTMTNLSAKKKYYIRVRTYKTVDGKKYYSAWSGYKTATTK